MRLMPHLRITTDGGWEVRISVPQDCRARIGKNNLSKRLGRVTESEANALAAPIIAAFKAQIRQARNPDEPLTISASFNHWLAGNVQIQQQPRWGGAPVSQPQSVVASTQVKIRDILAGYAAECKPVAATLTRWRRVLDNLESHVGHDDASRITPDDIVSWKTKLLTQVSPKTVKDTYLAGAKAIFGWALQNRKLETNPVAGISVRIPKQKKLRDKGFTPGEARLILNAALGPHSPNLAPHTARALRWVPWLCAYSGARVGELIQLRGADVSQKSGHWVILITPAAGTVKTKEARFVPIHEHLISTGFLGMVETVGDGPLFYGDGFKTANIATKLSDWVREIGVTDTVVQPSHAWRHLWKTRARTAGIADAVRDAIQGHATRTEGENYGEWMVEALATAMAKFPRYELRKGKAG